MLLLRTGALAALVSTIGISACGSSGSGDGVDAAAGSGGTGGAGAAAGAAGSGGQCAGCSADCGDPCACPGLCMPYDGGSDAGCHADPPPLTQPHPCGSTTCASGQICVHPCCGGAPLGDGEACKPAPPYCVDAAQIQCNCQSALNCAYGSECQGYLDSPHDLACQCG